MAVRQSKRRERRTASGSTSPWSSLRRCRRPTSAEVPMAAEEGKAQVPHALISSVSAALVETTVEGNEKLGKATQLFGRLAGRGGRRWSMVSKQHVLQAKEEGKVRTIAFEAVASAHLEGETHTPPE